jgi:hypothetical protein
MTEITFGDFAKLANKRRLTPEYLAERFKHRIERPSEFFHRIFQGKSAAVVIQYRSVLAFYFSELQRHQDSVARHNVCACGCGQAVFDRKKWASSGCKKRAARHKATDSKKGLCEVADFIEAKPGQNGAMATNPLTPTI